MSGDAWGPRTCRWCGLPLDERDAGWKPHTTRLGMCVDMEVHAEPWICQILQTRLGYDNAYRIAAERRREAGE